MSFLQDLKAFSLLFTRAIISSLFWGLFLGILFYFTSNGDPTEAFLAGFWFVLGIPVFIGFMILIPVVGWLCIIPAYLLWLMFFGNDIYPF